MIRNSIQHILYYEQQVKNEVSIFLSLFIKCVWVLIPFAVVEAIRKAINPLLEFFLSFMFWGIVICLMFYWMPTKKEMIEWNKKNHSTF